MNLEVLERVDSRWRVRVELPMGVPVRGFTVGLVGPDGVPLGPAVVGPESPGAIVILEVRGPCQLPPGAIARIVVHLEGGPVLTHEVVLARRRGLHAWLSADGRLPITSTADVAPMGTKDREQLARRWCWFAAQPTRGTKGSDLLSAELRDMLAELGVDADDVSDEVCNRLRGTER